MKTRLKRLNLGLCMFGLLALAQAPTAMQATQAELGGNVLVSPISNAFIQYAIKVATRPHVHPYLSQAPAVLRSECRDGDAGEPNAPSGTPPERILINDLRVRATASWVERAWASLETNCRILTMPGRRNAIQVNARASFRDSYGRGGGWEARTALMAWTMRDGTVLRVPTTVLRAAVSVASYHAMRIAAISFLDTRYALLVVLSPNLTRREAEAYFASEDFRKRVGYRAGFRDLWLPHLHLHQTTHWCVGSCQAIDVSQTIGLTLSDRGAGDAPELPKFIPTNGVPNLGVFVGGAGPLKNEPALKADSPFYVAIVSRRSPAVLFGAFIGRPVP